MRKFLKISFFIITLVFFLIGKKTEEPMYTDIVYFALAIPYVIYELNQIRADDKLNNTNTFRNRLLLVLLAAIVFVLNAVVLNWHYQP